MILLDLTHTSHSRARTGIQRVSRALRGQLLARGLVREVTWDKYAAAWRPLEDWELDALEDGSASAKRGADWPTLARWRGRLRRWRRGKGAAGPAVEDAVTGVPPPPSALLVPELFGAEVGAALPALSQRLAGPSVALFHDAIALQFPELSPPKTVARFPSYLRELARFDGIAAVSRDSRDVLLDYWRWAGLHDTPPVEAIPLGIEPLRAASAEAGGAAVRSGGPIRVLCVGTLEGRKNHAALLDAAEALWASGANFELRLIGMAQSETGAQALERVRRLREAGRPLRYDGPVDEATLLGAYAACDFTVYPSLYEGFGLPVLESLSAGKPCVCSARGALGESAGAGGCLALERVDANGIADGLRRMLTDGDLRARLAAEARSRRFRTWTHYADDLLAWLGTLPARPGTR